MRAGDCLVLNNSRVIPSRLFGHRDGLPGRVEVFLLQPVSEDRRTWKALVRPGRKLRVGEVILFENDWKAEILEHGELGERTLRFDDAHDVDQELERVGHVPLPPYIRRPDDAADKDRYQTVFAKEKGSVAAPTAGLHFTPEILSQCREAGADIAHVTLHVGLGTFQPMHGEDVANHKLHAERYEITAENEAKIQVGRQARRSRHHQRADARKRGASGIEW